MVTRGGEWEPIKISHQNLSYIPKSTRHVSLLARPRPHSYRKTIGPRNHVRQPRITVKNDNRCKQSHIRHYDNQNRTNGQLKAPCTFHWSLSVRDQEPITRAQQTLEELKSFDLMTWERYQLPPTSTLAKSRKSKLRNGGKSFKQKLKRA
jgi:hypothetical protein